jgi:putative ABC transport system substrate-binding protein
MKVQALEVRTPGELEETFKALVRERPGALLVMADRLFLHNRQRIMDFAIKQRRPGVYAYRELTEAGGLMSFGPSYPGMHRRAAYCEQNLKARSQWPARGAADGVELVINLKTAKALGLTIPPSLLGRADRKFSDGAAHVRGWHRRASPARSPPRLSRRPRLLE